MTQATCSIDGCNKLARKRGWCDVHYQRWRRNGDPNTAVRRPNAPGRVCSIEDCENPVGHARGWCSMHYARYLRHGDPETTVSRPHRAPGTCAVADCTRRRVADEFCSMHYLRWKRHGVAVGRTGQCRVCGDSFSLDGRQPRRLCGRPECRRIDARHRELARVYGLAVDDYDQLRALQGGGCAICRATRADSRSRALHVDHDHSTGKVRGLLCTRCNLILGSVDDDEDLLRRAVDYLAGHSR